MNIESETTLAEFHGWTLRQRESEGSSARLLLLLHGWTGDENSMWVFARDLPRHYWIFAPRAPHPTRPSGYSWRLSSPDLGDRPSLDDLRSSGTDLISLVDAYRLEQQIADDTFDLMGFSQGAALACVVALLFPQRIGKLGVLAGFVPKGAEALVAHRPLEGKAVFLAHGTQDKMVGIEDAERAAQLLETAGAFVTPCFDDVGHKLSARCLRGLHSFFT
ncbi:MAG TPA: alpha/beta fold hydrolase [Anaerolineales bacterium]